MQKIDMDIPADAESVTLNLGRGGGKPTLRNVLPTILDDVELVIEDSFDRMDCCDKVRMNAQRGSELAEKLKRSRVLEGETVLDLVPTVKANVNRGAIVLSVAWPKPDEED